MTLGEMRLDGAVARELIGATEHDLGLVVVKYEVVGRSRSGSGDPGTMTSDTILSCKTLRI